MENTFLNNFKNIDNGHIPKLNFLDYANVNMYGRKSLPKQEGFNIIKNNDMLQYHYFSQEYGIIKTSHLVSILDIDINNIKYNIGFASINCSILNKTLRRRYFGNNVYLLLMSYMRQNYGTKTNFCTINRTVMMPNFRGLGLAKQFQEETVRQLEETQDDIAVLELFSSMLHNFNFMSPMFKNLGTIITPENFDAYFGISKERRIKSKTKYIKSFKTDSITALAGYVFYIFKSHYKYFEEFYSEYYGVDLDFESNREITEDVMLEFMETNTPLVIWEKSNLTLEEIRAIDIKKCITDMENKYGPKKSKETINE